MEIDKIQVPEEIAKKEYKEYSALVKKRHDSYLKEIKKCMYELKQGRKLIDIYKVMEKSSLNKDYQPKIAIARADWKEVIFCKQDEGRGFFSNTKNKNWANKKQGDIDLQPKTFCNWPRTKSDLKTEKRTYKIDNTWDIQTQHIKTKVPIIPAQLMPEGELSNYYVLWEVQRWEDLPETKDPLLLKRITENLFVILGAWDVTPLEQSIIKGR